MEDMEELLSNPLNAVQRLFEERGVEGLSHVRDLFASCLLPENLHKIPLLSSSSTVYRDGTLVRYRGMVQDQYDPEMYCRVYEAVNHETNHKIKYFGQFRDIDAVPPGYEVDFDAPCSCHGDRTTLYCVPVPGETPWVINSHKPDFSTMTDSVSTQLGNAKRRMSDGDESDGEMEIEGDSPQLTKKARAGLSDDTSVKQKKEVIPSLNYPLPGETRSPCLVKVYREEEVFSVTAMVEFVGILSNDPALTSFFCEENDDDADSFPHDSAIEQRAHSPPPSLVPRLHCIAATLLTHTNPLIPLSLPTPTTTSVFQSVGCNVLACREAVVDMLATVLLGDRLAAEYVLFHLISSVYGRSDMLALGKFSINLTGTPSYLANLLHDLIKQIVSKIHLLPLTLDIMNNAQFSPHKDYTANRLMAGRLQLAPGTLLMVDETVLQAGKLSEKGVNNLTALGYLIQWQKLKYDFHYHMMEFDCDMPVMILSEARSILSVDCKVPLIPTTTAEDHPSCDALIADLPDNLLHQIRQYLTIARQLDYNLDDGLKKTLEDEFVEMRKNDSTMNADTFHHLLSLARLVSLSYGESTLSAEQWAITKRLNCLRQARIA